ncbi:ankyrin repeat and sam domain containing protein 6 [Colletotrichum camelliae]|nr:ankyrin repeat and sam domain containing protein 6 [Colletotrichum camelliae]
MNMADTTIPAYQYTPLPHPESIRILVLHPAEDRGAPIVCSFLDENPLVPTIEEWECRAVNPHGCTGECLFDFSDEEESSYGSGGEFPRDSAEDSEDELADEMQQRAVKSVEPANNNHENNLNDEKDDEISTGGNHQDTDKESEESDDTDDGLCSECGYDKYEEEHGDEENDDDCPCGCHNDQSVSINDNQSAVSLPKRKWHERVCRHPGFPEYEAISYTWGDAFDKLPITLGSDEAQIMVTQNCHVALQNLRLQASDRLLWIDALCINQDDDSERTDQVRIMGRVYAASYQVLIYLGEETPSSRIVFEELALAEKAPMVFRDSANRWEPDRPYPRPELSEALDRLLERPWFARVWVLQEAKNSRLATVPDAAVICGVSTSRSSLLGHCIFGYISSRATQHLCPYSLTLCYNPPNQTRIRLWKAITESLDYAATDSRDRVFALRGLITGNNAEFDDLINYTDGFELTFFKIAEYLLKSESNLWFLSLASHPHQMAMPSWIPSWTSIREVLNPYIEVGPEHLGPESIASANSTGELGLVPQEAQPGDVICYIRQAYFATLLRPRDTGGWDLIGGFCSRGPTFPLEIDVGEIISAGYEEVDFEIW